MKTKIPVKCTRRWNFAFVYDGTHIARPLHDFVSNYTSMTNVYILQKPKVTQCNLWVVLLSVMKTTPPPHHHHHTGMV